MGKFQQAIIHGNICAPNSPKFSFEEWENKFNELNSDEIDNTIFTFGQMTSKANAAFHSILIKCTKVSKTNFLIYLASFVNHNMALINKKLESGLTEIAKSDHNSSLDMLSSIPVDVSGGGKIDAKTAHENIFLVLKQSSWYINNMNNTMDSIDGETFYDIFNTITTVATINSFWTNILSGTYKYEKLTNTFSFINSKEEITKEISRLRRSNRLIFNTHRASINQTNTSISVIGYNFSQNTIITRSANKQELAGIIGELDSAGLTLDIFFREQLNGFGGISLGDIWHVYIALRGLRDDLAKKYFNHDAISELDDILNFHTIIDTETLITAISQAAKLDRGIAEKALEIFCYKFDRTEDPAAKFFIPVTGGLIPVLPTMFPQFDFLLSNWLTRGKAKIDKKGVAFEKYIRTKLVTFEKTFDITICKSAIKFAAEKTKEEIDLAFIFGNNLFICELKFFQYPADDIGFYQYKKNVLKAVSQVERKKSLVARNLSAFLSKHFTPRTIKNIYSLIITEQFECSGDKINDTLVIDSSSLLAFFSPGHPEILGAGGMIPKETEHSSSYPGYYKNKSTAAEDFISYIANPPQISSFMDRMKIKRTTVFDSITFEIAWVGDVD
ncbi:hypothetical protein DSECCO2_152400 [anaerobic digester metagenome]